MGEYFKAAACSGIRSDMVREVRGRGLMLAVELHPEAGGARRVCEALRARGVLAKDTHGHTIRIAPPLVITRDEVDWALEQIEPVLMGAAFKDNLWEIGAASSVGLKRSGSRHRRACLSAAASL